MNGAWMEVTMISRGVEISIAGGVAGDEGWSNSCNFFISFFTFFKSYVHCFYGTRTDMQL